MNLDGEGNAYGKESDEDRCAGERIRLVTNPKVLRTITGSMRRKTDAKLYSYFNYMGDSKIALQNQR